MPRKRSNNPRRPPTPFDRFFDELIDGVIDRVEDVMGPVIERLSENIADTVERTVNQAAIRQNTATPRPVKTKARSKTGDGILRCTLCGQRPKDCRCRGHRDTLPPPQTPHSSPKRRESTLYDVLEVSPRASVGTIKAAYRSLSTRFHPDRNPGNELAVKRMQEINAAWEVLGDEEKRLKYDRTLNV